MKDPVHVKAKVLEAMNESRRARVRKTWNIEQLGPEELQKAVRVVLPTSLSHWFGKELIGLNGPDQMLIFCTYENLEEIGHQSEWNLQEHGFYYPDLYRFMFGRIPECPLDKEGVLYIPEFLYKHLGSDQELICEEKQQWLEIKADRPPKCLCSDPKCAKCLYKNCRDPKCPIHTLAAKQAYRARISRN